MVEFIAPPHINNSQFPVKYFNLNRPVKRAADASHGLPCNPLSLNAAQPAGAAGRYLFSASLSKDGTIPAFA